MSDIIRVLQEINSRILTLENRIVQLETNFPTRLYMVRAADITTNTTVNADTDYYSPVIRGTNGILHDAKGIMMMITLSASGSGSLYIVASGDSINGATSNRVTINSALTGYTATVITPLGMDGKFRLRASGTNIAVNARIIGYWI